MIAIVVLVGVVPLGIFAVTVLRTHQHAFDARTRELHQKAAEAGAAQVEESLSSARRTLALSSSAVEWGRLSEAERDGALWLIFRQHPDFAVATLLDDAGEGLGAGAYLTEAREGHPPVALAELRAFASALPFEQARLTGSAVGAPFASAGAAPLVALAQEVKGSGDTPWVVAVALSLRTLCAKLPAVGPAGSTVYVVDPQGRVLCHPQTQTSLPPLSPARAPLLEGRGPSVRRLSLPEGEELLAATVTTPAGWSVVVEEPARSAFAANRRILGQAVIWLLVAIAIAVTAGLSFSTSITAPVRRLMEGARRLEAGQFDLRLAESGRDELAALSAAFNRMGAAVQLRDAEIRRWNEELTRRVEERTRERNEAQEQLLQSQTLAAVAGMGAGLAHEVNNPLTAVIGLAQVLELKLHQRSASAADLQLAQTLQSEAHRIRRIISTMIELAQGTGDEPLTPLKVPDLIAGSLAPFEDEAKRLSIEVVREDAAELPPVMGNAAQLQRALEELLKNARTAMVPGGGRLVVSAAPVHDGRMVRISVSDTGRGIAPENLGRIFEPFFTTKDEWQGQGLGLTVAYRIVEAHHGTLKAESTPGRGTTMTFSLPAARAAHLV